MNISGLKQLQATLKAKMAKYGAADAIVGYTAAYALYVHENMEMKLAGEPRPSGLGVYWGPNGGPKFLEQPARELAPQMREMIKADLKSGKTFEQALMRAGLFLQRESMQRVPVEYGNLRASAFTRLESK